MNRYKTIAKEATAEQVIEKSRFITHIAPVMSRQEAEEFIRAIREKHRNATHNVPAFIIGEKSELKWASDDGEPSGTSGAPMLQMLSGEELTNLVVVVTRYFGGIKLGTGGLVRAYTSSAKLGVEAAGICYMREIKKISFRLDYSHYGKIKNLEDKEDFVIIRSDFLDMVELTIEVPEESLERVINILGELTNGICSRDNLLIEKNF